MCECSCLKAWIMMLLDTIYVDLRDCAFVLLKFCFRMFLDIKYDVGGFESG